MVDAKKPPVLIRPPATAGRSRWLMFGATFVARSLVVLLGTGAVFGLGWFVFRTAGGAAISGFDRSRSGILAPTGETPVITTAEAAQVLRDYWRRHELALMQDDLAQLGKLAAGSAQAWERGTVACNCRELKQVRPLQSATYFVPRQSEYPAYFIAGATTQNTDSQNTDSQNTDSQNASSAWTELLVFTKKNAEADWLVVMNSGFVPTADATGPDQAAPLTGVDGYLEPIASTTTPGQRSRAQTAAANLAELWQLANDQEKVPDSADSDPADSDSADSELGDFELIGQSATQIDRIAQAARDLTQEQQLQELDPANQYAGTAKFFATKADPRFEAVQADGTLLSCQTVRERVLYQPTELGGAIQQEPDRATWGALLKPGTYRSVTTRSYWQTCFQIPRDPDRPITVLNQDLGGPVPRGEAAP